MYSREHVGSQSKRTQQGQTESGLAKQHMVALQALERLAWENEKLRDEAILRQNEHAQKTESTENILLKERRLKEEAEVALEKARLQTLTQLNLEANAAKQEEKRSKQKLLVYT